MYLFIIYLLLPMLCVQMHPAGASDPDKIPKLNSRNNKGGGGGARTREA